MSKFNCRVGRNFQISKLLWMPSIDLYIVSYSGVERAFTRQVPREEAEKLVQDLSGNYKPNIFNGVEEDWGHYYFREYYGKL